MITMSSSGPRGEEREEDERREGGDDRAEMQFRGVILLVGMNGKSIPSPSNVAPQL